MSGLHARIEPCQRGVFLRDLGSRNGTVLNGRRLQANRREPLRHKDIIQVCGYKLIFLDWSGYAKRMGLQTIRLDSEAIRKEADEIIKDFRSG